MGGKYKSPAAPVRGTEAEIDAKHDVTAKVSEPEKSPVALFLYAKDEHNRIASAIGFALTLGEFDAWARLRLVLALHLSDEERTELAYAALLSLDCDTVYLMTSVALYGTLNGEVLA